MRCIAFMPSLLLMLLFATFAHAEVAIVVSANSTINSINADDVTKIFLGKKKEHDGVKILPIDQTEGAKPRNEFYSGVVKKSESQLKSYWSRLIFTGKGQAPQVVGSDGDVKSMVSSNPNLMGYIDNSSVDGSVKVIFKQ